MGLTWLPPKTPQPVVAAVTINPSGPMPTQETGTKRDYLFIVNPSGANGYTGREWKRIFPRLQSRLSNDWNPCQAFTSGPSHAIEIARQAIHDGAAAVIAVGGDGTLHEVINGFFEDGKLVQPKELGQPRTALGLIPLGTGSDFARTFGWNNDPYQAIERVVKGQRRRIDIGRVVYGDNRSRYFVNVADVHLSAKAGFYAGKWKKFGNLCYVIGALQGFVGHQNRDLNVRIDGGEWQVIPKATAIAIGNARYFGGGMKISPTADPFSGTLEVVTLRDFKWYDFVLRFYKLYMGTHVDLESVTVQSVRSIQIEELDDHKHASDTYIQADGEHLGYLGATFSVIPGCIDFLV